MVSPVSGVNPEILRWARERAGYTIVDVALSVKKDVAVIEDWEAGKSAPTYSQLEKLAYQLYKRPLALFFFPAPPQERDPTQDFRTLPEFEIENLSSDTRYALRQGAAMQLALKELNEGLNPSKQKVFQDIQATANASPVTLARKVRIYLGVKIDAQKSWKSTEVALKHWRALVEDKGLFIFKRSFKQKDISGFCLVDKEFPIIYLNNSTAPSRQIFTLFHELAHILLHTSGVTKQNDRFINRLSGDSKLVEVFANQFSAELLVPSEDFNQHVTTGPYDEGYLSTLADRYRVSREVILRKLLDRNLVTKTYYEAKIDEWTNQYRDSRQESTGGDYYATQATYLGDKYLQLTFSKYYQGRYGIEQLADYLNVKVKSIPGLEQVVLNRALA